MSCVVGVFGNTRIQLAIGFPPGPFELTSLHGNGGWRKTFCCFLVNPCAPSWWGFFGGTLTRNIFFRGLVEQGGCQRLKDGWVGQGKEDVEGETAWYPEDKLYELPWGIFWWGRQLCKCWWHYPSPWRCSHFDPSSASICKRVSLTLNTRCFRAELRQALQKEVGWEGQCTFAALSLPPCWGFMLIPALLHACC